MSWKEIPGQDGRYEVSDHGQVRSLMFNKSNKARLLKLCSDGRGYVTVQLRYRRRYTVHRLVMLAFVGERPIETPHINHKNGIKTDNRLENLEYVTRSQNQKHAYSTGLGDNHGENHSRHKLTNDKIFEIRRRLASGERNIAIAKDLGVHESNISHIKRGRLWSHLKDCVGGVPSAG